MLLVRSFVLYVVGCLLWVMPTATANQGEEACALDAQDVEIMAAHAQQAMQFVNADHFNEAHHHLDNYHKALQEFQAALDIFETKYDCHKMQSCSESLVTEALSYYAQVAHLHFEIADSLSQDSATEDESLQVALQSINKGKALIGQYPLSEHAKTYFTELMATYMGLSDEVQVRRATGASAAN